MQQGCQRNFQPTLFTQAEILCHCKGINRHVDAVVDHIFKAIIQMNGHNEQFIPGVINFGHFLQNLKSWIQWEAFAIFTAAVMVSHLLGADAESAAMASMIFVVARVLHGVFYIANKDALRSLCFLVGFGCSLWLFLMAA